MTSWKLAPCGTKSAYQRHLRERKRDPKVVIDEACLEANRVDGRLRRQASQVLVERHNFRTRTYSTALVELSKIHAEEFRTLLSSIRKAINESLEDG